MTLRLGRFDQRQARPPATIALPPNYAEDGGETAVYWLSASGVLINSHGTTIMIDPLLAVISDDPAVGETAELMMTPPPILATDIETLDAVLYTHADNDHLGPITAQTLIRSGFPFHGTPYVMGELTKLGLAPTQGTSHLPGETFRIGNLDITLTPAFHPHQLFNKEFDSYYKPEDCCGFRITTPDGVIWIPGDSLLMNEHLEMKGVDLLFIDFSGNASHIGLDFAVGLANVHERADLIMYHWGTFYGPDHDWCNADPADALPRLRRPERLHILAPGEKFVLRSRAGE